MVVSFFRQLASRAKSKRHELELRALWSRPILESLDQRILPSVNATFDNSTGILSILADTDNGTTQVQIVQSQDHTQITVEDTGSVVNSFDLSQVQQIQFQYAGISLGIPVNGSRMTLTGFGINEADLTLGDSLGAAVSAVLPDGTPLSVAGSVDAQGHYDLTGTTDVNVGNFSLQGVQFELTDSSLAAAATLTLGNDSVSLAGTVDNQGNYDLTGTAAVNVDGFLLAGANFELTNTSLTAAAAVALGSDSVNLAGTVDSQGHYDLTGTADVNIAGFTLTGANFELTNTSLAVSGAVTFGSTNLSLSGSADNQGNYDLTGTADATIAGFTLSGASFELTNTSLTVSGALSVGGTNINLSGSVDNQGNYDLTGTADVTVAGFPIAAASFELTNDQLTAAGAIVVGSDHVALAGTVDSQGNYSLAGTAQIAVAGFAINAAFTLTNTQLAAAGTITVGGDHVNLIGTADNQGNYHLTGTAQVTVAGFAINAAFNLTNSSLAAAATVTVGSDDINLVGTVNSQGNYSLTGTAQVTVAGWGINAAFTLTNSSLAATGMLAIPDIGNLTFTGTVSSAGQYSLAAHTALTIVGVNVDATLTLTNTNLTIAAMVSLPVVGTVNLNGTVDNQGHFSLAANVSDINILFVTLTSASVTVTNSNVTVNGHATGIPLLGTVDFTGTISGGSYTFTATLPSVSILGFTLTNLNVTLNSTSLSVGAHAAGIPLVDTVDFSGNVTASGFSLSATASNVDLLGFIHFNTIALTLTQNSLSLSAATSLPVVGDVTFTGAINSSGNFTIAATAPSFTLLGFLTFNNATVSLSFPNPALTVSAAIDLLNIGHVVFSGTITAGGHFSFTASASLTVAGFTLGTGNLSFSDAPVNCINIGPFTTLPLPLVGAVTLQGMYCSGGVFSFQVTLHPTPPIMIGPIPVDTIIFGLSNDSLTLGIGIGYDLSSFLHIGGTGVVTVFAPSAQHDFGDFDLRTTVDVTLLGFQAAGVQMDLRNTRGQFSFTVDGNINLLIATVNVHGEIDFNKGLVGFAGAANIGVAGFTLSNSNFLITNAQVQFVNGMWTFPHDAQGHLIPGNGIHIEVHSHTSIPNFLNIDFDGTLTKSGASYAIAVHATANVTIAGFNLASARLDLDNTHLAIMVHYVQAGVFTVDFSGTMSSSGAFDLSGSASLGLAGFVSVASASFHLTNTMLTISANMDLKVAQVRLNGTFQSNGQFSLTGSASVGLGGYAAVTGSFTLNNGGASVHATLNLIVATVTFDGSIATNGTYSLRGSASVGLGGYAAVTGSFTLNNSGASVHAALNLIVATVTFDGFINKNGTYSLTGSAAVSLGGFTAVTGSFTLNNGGALVSARVNVIVAQVTFSGSINHNGSYSFQATAVASFAGFSWNTTFTIGNASGVSIATRMAFSIMGFTASFSGTVATNGSFRFTASTGLNFGPISTNLTLTLANTGFSAQVHASIDVSAGISWWIFSLRVGFRGSFDVGFGINTNGTFNASGNVNMCGYLGVGVCVGIGFSISSHQICVLTHNIGFSVWGVGFHPFGDLCFNY